MRAATAQGAFWRQRSSLAGIEKFDLSECSLGAWTDGLPGRAAILGGKETLTIERSRRRAIALDATVVTQHGREALCGRDELEAVDTPRGLVQRLRVLAAISRYEDRAADCNPTVVIVGKVVGRNGVVLERHLDGRRDAEGGAGH